MRTHQAAGQARRHRRSQRPRARVPASTPTRSPPIPSEIDDPEPASPRSSARALDDCTADERAGAGRAARSGSATFAYVAPPGVAGRGAARRRARSSTASASSRRAAATIRTASWRRTCSATSASTTTGWRHRVGLRRADPRQGRQGPRPDRRAAPRASAASSGRRRPARRIELTIDEYLQHVAERELRAGVDENHAAGGTRDHHGSAHRRDPRDGELSRRSTRTSTAIRRRATRRNRAVQDLYEPGSTFKIVTASAALEEKVMPLDDADRHQPGLHHASASRVDRRHAHDYGVLSFTDVIVEVEQRRRDQGRVAASAPSARAATSAASASASRCRRTFRGENAGIVWDADKLDDERARVGVDGLSDRRHAAADGGGGQLGRQRRRATSSRASCAPFIATAAAYDGARPRCCAGRSRRRRRRR